MMHRILGPTVILICGLATTMALGSASEGLPASQPAASHPEVDTGACLDCHGDVVDYPVVHGPTALGMCDACHRMQQGAGEMTVVLESGATSSNTEALCLDCHTDLAERLAETTTHAPVAAGDCLMCHSPHGSPFAFMLEAEGRDVCLICHDGVAEQLGMTFQHAPAARTCVICHDPHGSSFSHFTRAESNTLCRQCHVGPNRMVPEGSETRLFARPIPPSERDLLSPEKKISLDALARSGHPVMGHPVRGVPDPVDPSLSLRCASCHSPHGSMNRTLFQYAVSSAMDLCVKCH